MIGNHILAPAGDDLRCSSLVKGFQGWGFGAKARGPMRANQRHATVAPGTALTISKAARDRAQRFEKEGGRWERKIMKVVK